MFSMTIAHVLHALSYSTSHTPLIACKNRSMSSKNSLGRSRLAKWPPLISIQYFLYHTTT